LIAPHLGNWEITNYFVARHYPLVAMYAPPKLVALEKLIHAARERSGGQLVPANKRGVVAIFKHLRNAGVTGILPDQEPATKSGVFAPFYGHKVLTPVLVSKLIQETRAEAILVYALRLANGRFRLVFRPAHDAIYQSDIATSAAAMNRSIELAIREAPEQYQWEYKRFRKRPAGEPRRYPISTKQRKRIARSTSDS
jgi:KDO2-lipid IV(A) lauroyltransferase